MEAGAPFCTARSNVPLALNETLPPNEKVCVAPVGLDTALVMTIVPLVGGGLT